MVGSSIILPLITFYVDIYFTQIVINIEEVYKFRRSRLTRESQRLWDWGVCVREGRPAGRQPHVFFIIIPLLFSTKVFYFFQEYFQPYCGGACL